jgi:hypothetical protein
MGREWILVAGGVGFLVLGVVELRLYWPLWRSGVETRATIVKAFTPYLASVRFMDQAGQDHLIEKCSAPRFGKFVEGGTRGLTYLLSKPERWEWGRRKDHRFMVFLSLYLLAIGLGFIVGGLKLHFRP